LDQESRDPGAGHGAHRPATTPLAGESPAGPGVPAGSGAPSADPAAVDPAAVVPSARTPGTAEKAPGTAEKASDTARDERHVQDEHEELERLRAEVRELRWRAAAPVPAGRRGGRWRAPVAAVCIVLACVLAPVSVVGVWAANQVSNTDRYVANVTPLIHDPSIQAALSDKITAQITSRIDVPALVSSTSAQLTSAHLPRLSVLLTTFSGQIESGVDSLIGTTVARVVASPAVAALWVTANRTAHAGVVKVLSGQGNGSLSVQNGQVVLNIGPLITQVKDTLVARGLTIADRIPVVNATFPLFAAPNLEKAQQGYRLLTTLRWVLPILTLALFAAGIWVARSHRHALLGSGLGLAVSMLVLGIALTIARGVYLNSVPSSVLPSDAAGVLYDTLIRFVREALRALLVVGLIVAAGAFLTGPAAAAVSIRRAVRSGIGRVRDLGERRGLRTGPVGDWTATHKTVLRVAAVALVALIFVFVGEPTLALVIWLVLLLLVALGVIELLGGRPPLPAAAERASPAQHSR
jgi:hypothetical protein